MFHLLGNVIDFDHRQHSFPQLASGLTSDNEVSNNCTWIVESRHLFPL